jgi:hypothetical protein
MHGFDRFDGDDAGIVFRDLLTLCLCGFIVCLVLILPHVNPASAARTADTSTSPGNVMIEASWPADVDADVDLWVQGPGDIPVGYSNKSGALFNLLRDDLGHVLDVSGMNYEAAYSRGLLAGEYTVNLHLYRNLSKRSPVPAKVLVSVKPDAQGPSRQILVSDIDLARDGQERTVFRFRLDGEGSLVPDSVHNLQRPLRSGSK